jgi:5-methylcytosine-specific restriction endonuclease McrA
MTRPWTLKPNAGRLSQLFWAQSGLCALCGEPMDPPGVNLLGGRACSVEHVQPRSRRRSGRSGNGNFVASHRACNEARGNAPPDARLIALGWLVFAARSARAQIERNRKGGGRCGRQR